MHRCVPSRNLMNVKDYTSHLDLAQKKMYVSAHTPYILESNPHPFYSFRGLKIRYGLDSRADWIRGLELDFGKMIESLYVP